MAEAGYRAAAHHAHSSTHINFGHFGTATYDGEARRWSFLREDQPNLRVVDDKSVGPPLFKVLMHPKQVLDIGVVLNSSEDISSKTCTSRLMKALPEAAPGANYFAHSISSRPMQPHRADLALNLLSFGSALILGSDDVQSDLQIIPVAAFVSSAENDKLVLMLLDRESLSIDLNKAYRVHFPSISKANSTSWPSSSGPIQQLCFSARSSSQEATWLAVRQVGATTIFQPRLHRAKVHSVNTPELDLNLAVEIPISRSGHLEHADVAFHPRDPRQVTIVDIGGNWSIWKVKGTRSRSTRVLYCAHLVKQGSFVSKPASLQQFDGWHRILWSSSGESEVNRLLVANRQSIALFDLYGTLLNEVDVQIGSRKEGWLLDVLPSTSSGHYFFLTASHILHMTLAAADDDGGKKYTRSSEGISVLAYWSHFRGQGDNTLKLRSLKFPNTEWLFLSSVRTGITTAYCCSRTVMGHLIHYSISDAILFENPFADGRCIPCVTMQAMAQETGELGEYNGSVSFFKVFFQDRDRSIHETLYQICDPNAAAFAYFDTVPVPKKQPLRPKSARRVSKSTFQKDLGDFIIADNDFNDESDTQQGRDNDNDKNLIVLQAPTLSLDTLQIAPLRTCDLQRIYDAVTLQLVLSKLEDSYTTQQILDIMNSTVESTSSLQTLLELLPDSAVADMHVAEIEIDSDTLDSWLQQTESFKENAENEKILVVTRVLEYGSLLEIYNNLVDIWMSTLPSSIPDRIRVQKERLLRQMALDLYLSSTTIRPSSPYLSKELDQLPQNTPLTEAAASFERYSSNDISPASQPDTSTQATLQAQARSPFLSNYVAFRESSTPNKNASSVVENILAHLPTSSDVDPSTYSHSDVEVNLALAQNELAYKGLDSKARRKAEKMVRARQKQLEKQALTQKVVIEQQSALPSIMSSHLPFRGFQSSQAGPVVSSQPSLDNVPQVSMTQPERGAYGRRDAKKAKNKGRGNRQKGF